MRPYLMVAITITGTFYLHMRLPLCTGLTCLCQFAAGAGPCVVSARQQCDAVEAAGLGHAAALLCTGVCAVAAGVSAAPGTWLHAPAAVFTVAQQVTTTAVDNVQRSSLRGRHSLVNTQWTMVITQWSLLSGHHSVDNGHHSTVNSQWTMVITSGHHSVDNGHHSVVSTHWSKLTGQWSTLSGHWSSPSGHHSMVNT